MPTTTTPSTGGSPEGIDPHAVEEALGTLPPVPGLGGPPVEGVAVDQPGPRPREGGPVGVVPDQHLEPLGVEVDDPEAEPVVDHSGPIDLVREMRPEPVVDPGVRSNLHPVAPQPQPQRDLRVLEAPPVHALVAAS